MSRHLFDGANSRQSPAFFYIPCFFFTGQFAKIGCHLSLQVYEFIKEFKRRSFISFFWEQLASYIVDRVSIQVTWLSSVTFLSLSCMEVLVVKVTFYPMGYFNLNNLDVSQLRLRVMIRRSDWLFIDWS